MSICHGTARVRGQKTGRWRGQRRRRLILILRPRARARAVRVALESHENTRSAVVAAGGQHVRVPAARGIILPGLSGVAVRGRGSIAHLLAVYSTTTADGFVNRPGTGRQRDPVSSSLLAPLALPPHAAFRDGRARAPLV
ncbi:hypothetical protein SEVIR_5G368902v4 [Setaria viridis]